MAKQSTKHSTRLPTPPPRLETAHKNLGALILHCSFTCTIQFRYCNRVSRRKGGGAKKKLCTLHKETLSEPPPQKHLLQQATLSLIEKYQIKTTIGQEQTGWEVVTTEEEGVLLTYQAVYPERLWLKIQMATIRGMATPIRKEETQRAWAVRESDWIRRKSKQKRLTVIIQAYGMFRSVKCRRLRWFLNLLGKRRSSGYFCLMVVYPSRKVRDRITHESKPVFFTRKVSDVL